MLSAHFINWVVNRPWMTVGISLLIVFCMALGLKDYRATNNPRSFFGENNPEYDLLKDLERKYGNRETVVFIVHPKNDDIFTTQNLSLLEELTKEAWRMPNAIRASSLVNFQSTKVNGDELSTTSLVENAHLLTPHQIEDIRQIALHEPALLNSAVSASGHTSLVIVNVIMDEERTHAKNIAEWSKSTRDQFVAKYPDVEILLAGTVIFSDAMGMATLEGLTKTFPFSIAIAVILLLLILRSVQGTLYTLIVVVLSVAGGLGAAVTMGVVFQPVTSFGPAIILTLGIADSMHLLIGYQQQLRHGLQKKAAMMESLRVNLLPVILSNITTVVGFVSLNTSDSPPFRDLGNVVSIGVALTLWLTLAFLPALCMVTPAPKFKQGEDVSQRAMMALTEWIIKRRTTLVLIMLVVMIVPSMFVTKNELADVWSEYFDETFEVRRATDFLDKEIGGLHLVEMSVPTGSEEGIVDPEYLKNLDKLRVWAEEQPEVVYSLSFSDVIRRLNRDMNGGDPNFYNIPDDRALASQYLLMYEMSLPFGLGLDNAVTMKKDETLFVIVLKHTTSAEILKFKERTDAWIKANFPENMQVVAGGLDVMFAGATKRNIASLIDGMAFEFLLITLIMIISLRSLKYGLYSMLPNLAPCAMAFGIWALLHGRVGLTDSIVASITSGIVVDDTIHFLSKYVRARREMGLSAQQAVRYSWSNVGVALIATTIVLVADFAVLMTSHFYPSASMGFLTCLTLILALFIDLLFLSPLLILLEREPKKVVTTAMEDADIA